jgi:hypothetical protein
LYGTSVLNELQEPDNPPSRKIPLIFSRAAAGREPVQGWLKGLPEAERHAIGVGAMSKKRRMAVLLKTSRTQVDGLLDPKNDITLPSLQRAAAMVGRRVTIQLV